MRRYNQYMDMFNSVIDKVAPAPSLPVDNDSYYEPRSYSEPRRYYQPAPVTPQRRPSSAPSFLSDAQVLQRVKQQFPNLNGMRLSRTRLVAAGNAYEFELSGFDRNVIVVGNRISGTGRITSEYRIAPNALWRRGGRAAIAGNHSLASRYYLAAFNGADNRDEKELYLTNLYGSLKKIGDKRKACIALKELEQGYPNSRSNPLFKNHGCANVGSMGTQTPSAIVRRVAPDKIGTAVSANSVGGGFVRTEAPSSSQNSPSRGIANPRNSKGQACVTMSREPVANSTGGFTQWRFKNRCQNYMSVKADFGDPSGRTRGFLVRGGGEIVQSCYTTQASSCSSPSYSWSVRD